jgi:hypothetical protein
LGDRDHGLLTTGPLTWEGDFTKGNEDEEREEGSDKNVGEKVELHGCKVAMLDRGPGAGDPFLEFKEIG